MMIVRKGEDGNHARMPQDFLEKAELFCELRHPAYL